MTTAQKSQGKPLPGQRPYRTVLLLVVFGVAVWFVYKSRQPEQLMDLTMIRRHWITHGQLYWIQQDPFNARQPRTNGTTIYAMPVTGGTPRVVAREDSRQIAGDVNNDSLIFTDTSLFYKTVPPPPPGRTGTVVGMGGSMAISVHLGDFLAPNRHFSVSHAPWEKRQILPSIPEKSLQDPPIEIHLKRVPLSGGTPQEVARIPGHVWSQGEPIVVSGQNVYWLRNRPGERMQVTTEADKDQIGRALAEKLKETGTAGSGNPKTFVHDEVIGHSDLMVTSMKDGSARVLRSGLSGYGIFGGANAVFWTEPRVYPDLRQSLYMLHLPDEQIRCLTTSDPARDIRPAEYQGGFYWQDIGREYDRGNPPRVIGTTARILRARPEDTEARPVLSLEQPGFLAATGPFAQEGQLYLLFKEPVKPNMDADLERQPFWLCRLHPERAQPLEKIRTLPGDAYDFHFDQDYLYFERKREIRSLWDTLTNDEVNTRRQDTLYRVSLPHPANGQAAR